MSELHSTFTLSLFLGTAALFFASATHDAVGTGKGAGSAVLEKEEAIQSGKPGRSLSNSPREARRTKVGRSDGTMKQRERERERESGRPTAFGAAEPTNSVRRLSLRRILTSS
jgi:hypothetical protein